MKKQITVFIGLLIFFSGLAACNQQPHQPPARESTQSRLTPTKKDGVSTIMGRKIATIDYIMYGFINFDEHKIIKGANNLIEINEFIKDKMPKRRLLTQQIWDDLRDKQKEAANNIVTAFKKEDYKSSREYFKQLVANCMECHRLIKHQ